MTRPGGPWRSSSAACASGDRSVTVRSPGSRRASGVLLLQIRNVCTGSRYFCTEKVFMRAAQSRGHWGFLTGTFTRSALFEATICNVLIGNPVTITGRKR